MENKEHNENIKQEFTRQADAMEKAEVFKETDFIKQLITEIGLTGNETLLEVGCGPGIMVSMFARFFKSVYAVDITPKMIEKAAERIKREGLDNVYFDVCKAESLPYDNDFFDFVYSRFTLHHLKDPAIAIPEMARVVRPGGKIILQDIIASEDTEKAELHNAIETLRDPSHTKMLSLTELRKTVLAADLKIISQHQLSKKRYFSEWIQITNSPQRADITQCFMKHFVRAGLDMGIELSLVDNEVTFVHNSAIMVISN